MRLAVMADIHGNLQALEAVLEDMARFRPDMLLVGGDMVNRCVQGREVLETLQERPHLAVHGNADLNICRAYDENWTYDWPQMAEIAPVLYDQIGPRWARFLEELPDHRWIDTGRGDPVLLAHAMPGDPFHGVTSYEAEQQLLQEGRWPNFLADPKDVEAYLDKARPALFLTGHTHRQFERRIAGVRVVNPGSVSGQRVWEDGPPRAEYAILTWEGGDWSVEFRQVPFDVAETIRTLRAAEDELPSVRWLIELYGG